MISYELLDFCGINVWQCKHDILPYIFDRIYFSPSCIAILPIKKNKLCNNLLDQDLENLYFKMLAVLNLSEGNLIKANIYYETIEDLLIKKKELTVKVLKYAPKMILQFGEFNFIDQDLLLTKGVLFKNILHPQYLMKNPQNKKLAYEDLLECKLKIYNLNRS